MEVNTTLVPAGPPTATTKNPTNTHHHLHSESHSHSHFPSKTILITITVVTSVTVLLTIFVVVFFLRRQKPSNKNGTRKDSTTRVLHDTNSRLISTTLIFNSSPDVKGGCLPVQGGNLNGSPAPKFRGVQVFTYRELEVATDGFIEANVIGNGGYGLMYRGVLSDGTLAAIKLLRREGKQGERAFRTEVSE